jgi:hypothetical protein
MARQWRFTGSLAARVDRVLDVQCDEVSDAATVLVGRACQLGVQL